MSPHQVRLRGSAAEEVSETCMEPIPLRLIYIHTRCSDIIQRTLPINDPIYRLTDDKMWTDDGFRRNVPMSPENSLIAVFPWQVDVYSLGSSQRSGSFVDVAEVSSEWTVLL